MSDPSYVSPKETGSRAYPPPTFIYKLIPASAAPPDPLPVKLPLSELDKSSGFIHLSTARQVPHTLARFYAHDTRMYVLRISYEKVRADIRWEDSSGQVYGGPDADNVFPHLYNDQLGSGEAESVVVWDKGESETWDKCVADAAAWLVDY
ncbi:hypothetical protein HGRIS_007680 [Hohenbuehelia grisea]|uniref:Uncharacterized protein n=1 Tax=Hohenbuehelia grisea TaxID=104357 RepID=A0ABR3J5M2_9AGAR